jgi:hypothetical protein
VAVDLNTKFTNIDSIKEAIDKVEKEEAREKAKETKSRPERVSARKVKANILRPLLAIHPLNDTHTPPN